MPLATGRDFDQVPPSGFNRPMGETVIRCGQAEGARGLCLLGRPNQDSVVVLVVSGPAVSGSASSRSPRVSAARPSTEAFESPRIAGDE